MSDTDPAADARLALYLPTPAADYVVAYDTHRGSPRPYLAQHTTTLGRASTHEDARRIIADHHDQPDARPAPEIPFGITPENAIPLLMLGCRVAYETEHGGGEGAYKRALRWVGENGGDEGLDPEDVHELAVHFAGELGQPRS